jgi:hypothetical protein
MEWNRKWEQAGFLGACNSEGGFFLSLKSCSGTKPSRLLVQITIFSVLSNGLGFCEREGFSMYD